MIKLLHTADLHLGYRQYGYQAREQDYYETLDGIVNTAIARQVNALLIAGDVFDSPKPPSEAVHRLQKAAARAQAAGVSIVAIDGNHDPSGHRWLDICGIERSTLTIDGARPLKIVGIPFMRPPALLDSLKLRVDRGENIDVLMLHQPLVDFNCFTSGLSIEMLMPLLKQLRVDYVALGDIHDFHDTEVDGIRFVYPGCPDNNEFGESDEKLLVEIVYDGTERQLNLVLSPRKRKICVHDLDAFVGDTTVVDPEIGNKFLKSLDADCHCGLNMLQYSQQTFNAAKLIGAELHADNVLFHLVNKRAIQKQALQLERQVFERKEAREHLRAAVIQAYPQNTPEHDIIMKMLDSPGEVAKVLEEFLKSEDKP